MQPPSCKAETDFSLQECVPSRKAAGLPSRRGVRTKSKKRQQDGKRNTRLRSLQLRDSRLRKLAQRGEVRRPRNFKPTRHRRGFRRRDYISSVTHRLPTHFSHLLSVAPSLHPRRDISAFHHNTYRSLNTSDESTGSGFNNLLLRVANSGRLGNQSDEKQYESDLRKLFRACGDDLARWKLLVLTLVHMRYHLLSPEAKANKGTSATAGKGERKLFYEAVSVLFSDVMNEREGDDSWSMKLTALQTLVALAPLAGGSRDVAALIEEIVSAALLVGYKATFGAKKEGMMALEGKESLSPLVAYGVQAITNHKNEGKACAFSVLFALLQVAADMLDHDLDLIERQSIGMDDGSKLPSTIHVFLPHNNRGRSGKKRRKDIPWRQIVNCVAEVLIWAQTRHANENKRFVRRYQELLDAVVGAHGKNAEIAWMGELPFEIIRNTEEAQSDLRASLHSLQTIIRKGWRHQLNEHAREKGFMLSEC